MSQLTEITNLNQSILSVFEQHKNKVLFKDDFAEWTGESASLWVKKIQKFIYQHTSEFTRVAVCFPNSCVSALSILAIMECNRIPVILNHIDVTKRAQTWVEYAKSALFLTTPELAPQIKVLDNYFLTYAIHYDGSIIEPTYFDLNSEFSLSHTAHTVHTSHTAQEAHTVQAAHTANPANHSLQMLQETALILYTSGSTGKPKEVLIPKKGLLKTIDYLIQRFSLNESTVSQVVLAMCHSMALNTQFFPTFFAGGFSRFYNSSEGLNKYYRSTLAENVTFVSLIGELIRTCWDEKQHKKLPPCLTVEHIQLAGGLISPHHLSMALDLFPNAKIHKGYGLTEAIRVSMIDSTDPLFYSPIVGYPLPFLELQVRDEFDHVLPTGEIGQVYVKGDSVMVNTPYTYLPTGDIGEINENGYLTIYGREDSLFKINGKRISGFEIEKTVYRTSEVFRQAKCLPAIDERTAGTKLILYIELDSSEILEPNRKEVWQNSLWSHLRNLDYYPREIVLLENFPTTSNGKIDLAALKTRGLDKNRKLVKESLPFNLKFYTEDMSQ